MTRTEAMPSELGASDDVVLRLRDAELTFGDRTLWSGLNLDVRRGEFIAVLGANGSGKSSLLKAILGVNALTSGEVQFRGGSARRTHGIGYIPQQRLADDGTPARGRDMIAFGVDWHRWGLPLPSKRRRQIVDDLVRAVGAEGYNKRPLSFLSGGEQQRIRVGQALAGDPSLLLCDEPLLSLDLANQQLISDLVDRSRREKRLGVLFVTHDINPILSMVDRVLYLANGEFRIGRPEDVLRSDVLSELYGAPVDVIHTHGRVIVVGAPDDSVHAHHNDIPANA